MYFDIPEDSGESLTVRVCVSASNADPKERWDEIEIYADRHFSLSFTPQSAYMYNNFYSFKSTSLDYKQQLGDRIITYPGAPVGYEDADGYVRGGSNIA